MFLPYSQKRRLSARCESQGRRGRTQENRHQAPPYRLSSPIALVALVAHVALVALVALAVAALFLASKDFDCLSSYPSLAGSYLTSCLLGPPSCLLT